ncbi:MAG: hypothetical protein P8Y23_08550 [Candidatus Lokiarchaeota archaeon]
MLEERNDDSKGENHEKNDYNSNFFTDDLEKRTIDKRRIKKEDASK